jgi:hypothetical protein
MSRTRRCLKRRAAADRLPAGTPLHSSGKLTILDLAEEAQVKRWLLTHKYPTTLMTKYQAEFKAARHKSEPVKKAEAEIDKLREDLTRVRKEKRQLANLLGTYAFISWRRSRPSRSPNAMRPWPPGMPRWAYRPEPATAADGPRRQGPPPAPAQPALIRIRGGFADRINRTGNS